MTRVRLLKTNFTAGEIAPLLHGRGDLRAYANGAARLRNVLPQATGGVARRPGFRHVAAAGPGRLASFEFNTEQTYLLHFGDGTLRVHVDGVAIAELATPWTLAHLPQLAWTQSADTLLVVHPEVEPRRVTRTGAASWTIEPWRFVEDEGALRVPFHKFAREEVTLTASGTSGTITLTASTDLFEPGHVGTRFRRRGRQVEVTSVASPTEATAEVRETLAGAAATPDWDEQAFSPVRGWPATVVFHQDRLVIGGSRDLPNRLWLSKASELFSFDLGDGLDDEAIEFPILSDQVNAIRAVFSGRHLQVFTSGAEWMVTGDPLAPATVQVRRQTRVGSLVERAIPPRDVDGATLFVARNGRELREFLFADIEQAYQAADLAILAGHLFRGPVDQDYDGVRRTLFVVTEDGGLLTLTLNRAEGVTAWARQETAGAFRAVAVVGDTVYVLVERSGAWSVEALDDRLSADAGVAVEAAEPVAAIAGLDHLEGATVAVVADGTLMPPTVVTGGAVALDPPAKTAAAGLPFRHEIAPLPPAAPGGEGSSQGTTWRVVEASFRLHDTGAFAVDLGGGLAPVPFRRFGQAGVLDGAPPRVSGEVRLRASGWRRGGTEPPWLVAGEAPLPCTLLSVTTELKVNG